VVILPNVAASVNKWEGEDEDEDIKVRHPLPKNPTETESNAICRSSHEHNKLLYNSQEKALFLQISKSISQI